MNSRSPLIVAILLLLLPLLHVGSYFALVKPEGEFVYAINRSGGLITAHTGDHYRIGERVSERLFWPLEQIDRIVRPEAWDDLVWVQEERRRSTGTVVRPQP